MNTHTKHTDPAVDPGTVLEPNPTRDRAPRVLLAEDDDDVRHTLAMMLRSDGFVVHAFSSGAEMLNYLASWILRERDDTPADAIITDIRMPGFSGLTIADGLRDDGWHQPIIVISAFGDEEIRKHVKRLGRARFIAKPFDPAALEAALMEMIPV